MEKATFAAGVFGQTKGVIKTWIGQTGKQIENPGYEKVILYS